MKLKFRKVKSDAPKSSIFLPRFSEVRVCTNRSELTGQQVIKRMDTRDQRQFRAAGRQVAR